MRVYETSSHGQLCVFLLAISFGLAFACGVSAIDQSFGEQNICDVRRILQLSAKITRKVGAICPIDGRRYKWEELAQTWGCTGTVIERLRTDVSPQSPGVSKVLLLVVVEEIQSVKH